jgi:hypothetical protein
MSQVITEEKKDIIENGVSHRQSYVFNEASENQETVDLLKPKLDNEPVSIPVDKVPIKNTNRPKTAKERFLKNLIYVPILFIFDRISFVFTFSFILLSTLSGLCLLLAFSSRKLRKIMHKAYKFSVFSFKTVFFENAFYFCLLLWSLPIFYCIFLKIGEWLF